MNPRQVIKKKGKLSVGILNTTVRSPPLSTYRVNDHQLVFLRFCFAFFLLTNIVYPYTHTDPEHDSESSSSAESALASVGQAPQEVAWRKPVHACLSRALNPTHLPWPQQMTQTSSFPRCQKRVGRQRGSQGDQRKQLSEKGFHSRVEPGGRGGGWGG